MKKLLIVDDQEKFSKMLAIKLRKMGYEVHTANNGKQGVEKAEEVVPSLIIMDIMMPEMNGFDAAELIKKSSLTANIPLIFLSAKGQESDLARAKELGAVDFFHKPFTPAKLISKIEELCS